jgi:hypothetical protein
MVGERFYCGVSYVQPEINRMTRTDATCTANRMLAAKQVSLRSRIRALVDEACKFKRINEDGSRNNKCELTDQPNGVYNKSNIGAKMNMQQVGHQ